MKKCSLLILTFLTCSSLSSLGQERMKELDIRSIEQRYQSCLNDGSDMAGCSIKFYKEMDSCLNVAYVQLRQTLNERSKAALKKEQLAWLKARDLKFVKIDNVHKGNLHDEKMFRFHEKAKFVRDRTIILLKWRNK